MEVASRPGVQTSALGLEDAQKRSMADKQLAAAFGEIVLLLLRSRRNNYSVADLDWLVAPAVGHGQFALAEARSEETGAIRPVGAILWAMVSDDVDKRLSDITAPLRLKPNEWRSGDIPWIVLATGGRKVIEGLIQQLSKTVFKGKPPKTPDSRKGRKDFGRPHRGQGSGRERGEGRQSSRARKPCPEPMA